MHADLLRFQRGLGSARTLVTTRLPRTFDTLDRYELKLSKPFREDVVALRAGLSWATGIGPAEDAFDRAATPCRGCVHSALG